MNIIKQFINNKFNIFLIGILIGIFIMDISNAKTDKQYNQVKLDSIKVNINHQDIIMYRLKFKLKYNNEENYQISDSSVIELFKEMSVLRDTIK